MSAEIESLQRRLANAYREIGVLKQAESEQAGYYGEILHTQVARIRELEEHEKQTHEILGSILGEGDSLEEVAKRAMRRVTNLEGWLVEERAWRICHRPDDRVGHWPQYEPLLLDEARNQLIKDGKLGADNPRTRAKTSSPTEQVGTGVSLIDPPKPMLTRGQREALDFAVRWLDDDPCDFLLSPIGKGHREALRSLLSSPPAWKVTGKRKDALQWVLDALNVVGDEEASAVLQAMLDEARP